MTDDTLDDRFNSVFSALNGHWKLERVFSTGDRFSGTAKFSDHHDGKLLLEEEGEIQLSDGSHYSAARCWVWELLPAADLLIHYHEDPLRLYHHVKLVADKQHWCGSAVHHCNPDVYSGDYRIGRNLIEIRQRVSGPKKDYELISAYSK